MRTLVFIMFLSLTQCTISDLSILACFPHQGNLAQVINLNFLHLSDRLLEELSICMAPVFEVAPVGRPTPLIWSVLTFISMLKG